MDPITASLIASGVLSSVGAISQGVGGARAAKRLALSPAEQRELEELERRRRTGEALSERERSRLESEARVAQAGAARQLEASALQQVAAASTGGPVSGRSIFLREQAEQSALRGLRQEQNLAIRDAERAAEATNAARIEALRRQQREADALRIQSITGAVAGVADVGAQIAGKQFERATALELQAAELATLSDDDLFGAVSVDGYDFSLLPNP